MDSDTMDAAYHDSRFTAEISKRMQVRIKFWWKKIGQYGGRTRDIRVISTTL